MRTRLLRRLLVWIKARIDAWTGDDEYAWLDDDDEYDDEFTGWLCICGHWEESYFHCRRCFREPPWGCDCGCQDEHHYEDDY